MHEPVVVPKREIAREFLDAAIEFYLAGTNLICAVHLRLGGRGVALRVP